MFCSVCNIEGFQTVKANDCDIPVEAKINI
jgi:hypothetical protein